MASINSFILYCLSQFEKVNRISKMEYFILNCGLRDKIGVLCDRNVMLFMILRPVLVENRLRFFFINSSLQLSGDRGEVIKLRRLVKGIHNRKVSIYLKVT